MTEPPRPLNANCSFWLRLEIDKMVGHGLLQPNEKKRYLTVNHSPTTTTERERRKKNKPGARNWTNSGMRGVTLIRSGTTKFALMYVLGIAQIQVCFAQIFFVLHKLIVVSHKPVSILNKHVFVSHILCHHLLYLYII